MKRSIQILNTVAVLITLAATKVPAQNPNAACPLGFFTNVASRLLSSEMNLNLTQIVKGS